MKIFNHFYLII